MSEVLAGAAAGRALRLESVGAVAVGGWLRLAAAPTFAIMALLTSSDGGGLSQLICSAASDASPLSGMTTMYLLMSVFHLPPWLKLIFVRPERRENPHPET